MLLRELLWVGEGEGGGGGVGGFFTRFSTRSLKGCLICTCFG